MTLDHNTKVVELDFSVDFVSKNLEKFHVVSQVIFPFYSDAGLQIFPSFPPTLHSFPRLPCRWGLGICKNLGGGWA